MNQINREALFCDETVDYRCPCEAEAGQEVVFRFRTARDGADSVCLVEYGADNGKEGTGALEHPMFIEYSDSLFDYYRCNLTVGEEVLRYSFRVSLGSDVCCYDRAGSRVPAESEPDREKERASAFRLTPGFHVPEWCKGAVMYQIFVDRFRNGDPSNDVESKEYVYIGKPVERVTDWGELPTEMDVRRFYGGDLRGILDKLAYLKSLKVEVLYLNPIFVSPSNHKYDCQDYDHVDPHYGVIVHDSGGLVPDGAQDNDNADKYAARTASEENLKASDLLFMKLVKAAHELGMRVIIDGVFNHCGSFNKWMDAELIYQHEGGYDRGAYVTSESRYRQFFKFQNREGWPFNDSYEGWWGHNTLPKLNYEDSPVLYRYIMNIAKKWVSPPFNADGWRLDVAADLGHSEEFNHQFWRDFRSAVKEANPDAVLIAEHYGDPSAWLEGDQWDTVMNYDAFMEPVSWFLTGMEKHSDAANEGLYGNGTAFFDAMKYHMGKMQTPSLMAAMNELSNHDHSRFMTRTNRRVGRLAKAGSAAAEEGISYGIFRQGVVMLMTWPGAPTIYYGDETGLCGWTDPDNRRTYPWGHEDQELIEFHRYMTGIRRRCPAFRTGSLLPLLAGDGVIAYGRFQRSEDGGQTEGGMVVVNTYPEKRRFQIPVWRMGVPNDTFLLRVMLTHENGYNAGTVERLVKDGFAEVEVPAVGSVIFAFSGASSS